MLVATALGATIVLAGCGGGSGSNGSSSSAATNAGSTTRAQSAQSSTTTQGSSSSSPKTAASASRPTRATRSNGFPVKRGPASKIKTCLTAGKASVSYTPKAHGYGALLAKGPAGGQMMIVAAPSAAEAKDFLRALKPSQPIETHSANGGKTIVMLTKNPAPSDRTLALKCAATR
jgi:hypothetical protein